MLCQRNTRVRSGETAAPTREPKGAALSGL